MKPLALLPLLLAPTLAAAQTPAPAQIMVDVRNGDFADAQTLAAQTNDPLLQKLVTFFRLTRPGGGTAGEIGQFIAQNPDWPEQRLLALRQEQAAGTAAPEPTPIPVFITDATALHAAGQDIQAAGLWSTQGAAAFAAAGAEAQQDFWPAQSALARALLAANDAQNAYAVITAVDPGQGGAPAGEQVSDRDFLAGFVALRILHQPAEAAQWFRDLGAISPAIITQARAYYWLARTESGDAATADYQRAANYPTTYYGQLAAIALGDSPRQLAARINAIPEPAYTAQDALYFGLMELPRAATLLAQMNDAQDAAMFLNRLGAVAIDDKSREMAARLALGLGLPQSAVAIARLAGAQGQMLAREGWPTPYTPPDDVLDQGVAYGIMRQESSFDVNAISGSGAMGLMQLMPATARATAHRAGLGYGNPFNPDENMRLGTDYLAGEVQNFGNCLPLAIAAYNAGPTNVANWLAANGDPELGSAAGGADIIDWIEEIPFQETRNYVQRVSENITIYRAGLTGAATSPLSPWLAK